MNIRELSNVQGGETEGVEFKKTTGRPTEGMRTVCGMLNGAGGFVLFGVTAGGKIIGQIVTTQTLEHRRGDGLVQHQGRFNSFDEQFTGAKGGVVQ